MDEQILCSISSEEAAKDTHWLPIISIKHFISGLDISSFYYTAIRGGAGKQQFTSCPEAAGDERTDDEKLLTICVIICNGQDNYCYSSRRITTKQQQSRYCRNIRKRFTSHPFLMGRRGRSIWLMKWRFLWPMDMPLNSKWLPFDFFEPNRFTKTNCEFNALLFDCPPPTPYGNSYFTVQQFTVPSSVQLMFLAEGQTKKI